MQKGVGILGRRQRILAWVGFFALAVYAPLIAFAGAGLKQYGLPPDTWMFSATVAGLVAFVLIIDDVERRKVRPVRPDLREGSDQ